MKKDGSPTGWEKYYTDDVIDSAVNEYVTFKVNKVSDKPLSAEIAARRAGVR